MLMRLIEAFRRDVDTPRMPMPPRTAAAGAEAA